MSNLIQQLKQKFVFGWVSTELQAKCREIGRLNFEGYYDDGWRNCTAESFDDGDRLKLKDSYTEEPKVIRVDIENSMGQWVVRINGNTYPYPLAPAVPPKGYEFECYLYENGTKSQYPTSRSCGETILPIAVLYWRLK